MNIRERQSQILSVLNDKEFVTVEELSEMLDVTKVTIRSDLSTLEEKGMLVRVHGGATITERKSLARIVSNTLNEYRDEKMRIAKRAAALVHPDQTIIIDSGSTTVHMVRYLSGKRITLVTGSLIAIDEAAGDESLEVVVFGGMLRRASMGVIGGFARHNLEQIHADFYFMGASGYTKDQIFCSNLVEAETKQAMMRSADRVCFLADSSKFGKKAFANVSSWDCIDYFITDAISDELRNELESKGVSVIIA